MPGPMPKRSSERRRRNKDGVEIIKVNLDEAIAGEVEIPAPPYAYADKDGNEYETPRPLWHPTAEEAYLSLARSGQAIFMEPSDWATAFILCETISRELKPKPIAVKDELGGVTLEWVVGPVNGAVLNAFLKGWASLMATEGDRRKLRIELERQKRLEAAAGGEGKVVDIVQRRQDAFKGA